MHVSSGIDIFLAPGPSQAFAPFSPAMVLRNMRYSKLEISRLCQRWVMLEDLKSWRGVAREIRLQTR